MEYTKGEWKAHFEYLGGYDCMSHSYDIEAGKQHIATLDLNSYEGADGKTEEEVNALEAKANAHLIAAAPKMYEALKRLAETFRIFAEEGGFPPHVITGELTEANNVLSKIDGGE